MCGIFCSILFDTINRRSTNSTERDIKKYVSKRGPDAENTIILNNMTFSGFVLWQQGSAICYQPATNDTYILLYNGDAFNIGEKKDSHISDTEWILNELQKLGSDSELCNFFRTLQGPFSIVFYNKETKNLYFARDSFGRNSLIIEKEEQRLRLLSTTCLDTNMSKASIELPPIGIYKLSLLNSQLLTIYPWTNPSKQWHDLLETVQSKIGFNVTIGSIITPKWLRSGTENKKENYDFYKMVQMSQSSTHEIFLAMLKDVRLLNDLKIFAMILENSVRERVRNTTKHCAYCIPSLAKECNHSKIGILFSGGIDCTILAVIVNKYVDEKDSVDLINVAFESVRTHSNSWDVPDRCSALRSFSDLQRICPNRKWNFIEVNILRDELDYCMLHHIKNLIYPLTSVLDESIGCAFWFASRGIGLRNGRLYKSSSKVIIVGSGADELFAGYRRHRNAYRLYNGNHHEKQLQVLKEIEKDWDRIPSRNLGRDDRVIADSGKTSRAPFIEENVFQFIQTLHLSQRCCFLLEEGVGDKLFLRLYGFTIGIRYATQLKKRAIQFGSRIAKKSENANDISRYFLSTCELK